MLKNITYKSCSFFISYNFCIEHFALESNFLPKNYKTIFHPQKLTPFPYFHSIDLYSFHYLYPQLKVFVARYLFLTLRCSNRNCTGLCKVVNNSKPAKRKWWWTVPTSLTLRVMDHNAIHGVLPFKLNLFNQISVQKVIVIFVLETLDIKMNSKGEFLCPQCKRPYRYKSSVYTHLKNDCGKEHQYRCDPCDFSCKFEHVLRRHKLSFTHQKKAFASESRTKSADDV